MEFNETQQIIVDLLNEYDDEGYILREETLRKYEKIINELKSNKRH